MGEGNFDVVDALQPLRLGPGDPQLFAVALQIRMVAEGKQVGALKRFNLFLPIMSSVDDRHYYYFPDSFLSAGIVT